MDIIGELQDLQQKAMLFATETNRELRWKAGFWLEAQVRAIDDKNRITDGFNNEAKIELSALLTIIFDMLLYDKLEDSDWIETLPDHYDGDLDALVKEMRSGA